MQYTDEMKRFITRRFKAAPVASWVDEFNDRFNADVSTRNLYAYCKRHGIRCNRDGRFLPGQKPWNDGKPHPTSGRSGETQFRKGENPLNTRPLGSTRIDAKDGYLRVKVGNRTWRPKHLLVWEEHNGEIPKGHIVRFFDRTPEALLNPTIDNLYCVSRGVNARLNKIKANEWPSTLRETLILIAKLEQKQYELR